ncbi:hypothetical protein HDE_08276 [Halotydeus destructor]|nr:hypothetical protein HDE_08276 [Halotydeus destructor]
MDDTLVTKNEKTIAVIGLIAIHKCKADQEFNTDDFFEDEDEDDYEPIQRRQFTAVRDTVRNAFTNSVRFITNNNILRNLRQALQNARPVASAVNAATSLASGSGSDPLPAASSLVNAVSSAAASVTSQGTSMFNNVLKNVQNVWSRRTQAASATQNELRKRFTQFTKRLSNNRIIIGSRHKMMNRDGATNKGIKVMPVVKTETKIVPLLPQFIPVPVYPQW